MIELTRKKKKHLGNQEKTKTVNSARNDFFEIPPI